MNSRMLQIGYEINGHDMNRKVRKIKVPATNHIPRAVLMQSLCIIITPAKVRIKRQKAKQTEL